MEYDIDLNGMGRGYNYTTTYTIIIIGVRRLISQSRYTGILNTASSIKKITPQKLLIKITRFITQIRI